ncbi:MAG: alpha-ribazole phosphatase family protein [Gammaproteobacteria bacterium]|nr:alpha-ribazole phosphatase family protein [Gammaproteobacteria bacterium]MBU1656253.1 alpha-ribazole phosphatase family protein [Gammaproteobacteria bacterium]MBU1959818.1 alpha-ribazole phosphatase family protein [Gammaproteobacteria bacterium]
MSLLIDLLRHGEVARPGRFYGTTDVALSDRGSWQMESATRGGAWDAVYCSPLRRCADFARRLAERKDLPLIFDARLAEIEFGKWEGRNAEEIISAYPGVLEGYWADPTSHTPEGAESIGDLFGRVVEAASEIAASCRGKHLLLITHGGVIRTLLAWTLDMPLSAVLRIEVVEAGMSRIRIPSSGKPSLVFHDGGAMC